MTARTLTVRGTPIKLLTGGSGPPLLFLHGAGGAGRWLPFHEHLVRRFTLPRGDHARAVADLAEVVREIGARGIAHDERVAKVSIVGVGMRSHSGVASTMFAALAREGINIQMISTSEIAVSCVIEDKYAELAVRTLHDAFDVGKGVAR